MNYLSVYNSLINKRKSSPVPDNLYSELHHIIPKCHGGSDSPDNLVRLTAKEHYLAHHLLYKHYRTPQLAHAWFSMFRRSGNQKRVFTAKQYEMARAAHIEILKETMAGKKNPFYGKKHSEKTRKQISNKVNEWYSNNDIPQERINNWIEKVAKKPASDKQKAVTSLNSKGKIVLKNIITGECIKIDKSDKMMYNENIWKNPAAISQAKDTCIFCGKESNAGNIKRWHNENCKYKG